MTDTGVLDCICPSCEALPGERCGDRLVGADGEPFEAFLWGFHDERYRAAGFTGCLRCFDQKRLPPGYTCPGCGRHGSQAS